MLKSFLTKRLKSAKLLKRQSQTSGLWKLSQLKAMKWINSMNGTSRLTKPVSIQHTGTLSFYSLFNLTWWCAWHLLAMLGLMSTRPEISPWEKSLHSFCTWCNWSWTLVCYQVLPKTTSDSLVHLLRLWKWCKVFHQSIQEEDNKFMKMKFMEILRSRTSPLLIQPRLM